jgi:spore maturation protein SpmA
MLNWIWLAFVIIAMVVGALNGRLPDMTKGAFETAEMAVMKIALPLIGIWALWLGIMRLAEQSGLVQLLARALRPLMRLLFPDVPPGHPAIGAIVMNMAANMLGVGNAATPLGLRAMAQLERLNPHPGVATNAMCTFLAVNTASIQLIPTTAIGILAVAKAVNPTAIVPTAFLSTLIAASSGVLAAKLLERLPLFRVRSTPAQAAAEHAEAATIETAVETISPRALTPWRTVALIAFMLIFVGALALYTFGAPPGFETWLRDWFPRVTKPGENPLRPMIDATLKPGGNLAIAILNSISILAVPFLLSFFPLYAACRGVKVYEQFVEGAKEAFPTAQRVIPFLVAMLLAISLLRNSGVLDLFTRALRPFLALVHFPGELLPLVLMRPLSGSASQGIFVELVNQLANTPNSGGADSFLARAAATIYGSTETTFYVLAVYFGAVAVRQTRHAVAVGLIADTVAVIASIALCSFLFGR